MSKNLVVFLIGIILVVGISLVLLINLTKKDTITSPIDEKNQKLIEEDQQVLSANMKEYIDSSGFKFKYPDNFAVATANQVNENVYSSLTIASDEMENKATIQVEATSSKSLDDWLTQNPAKITKETLKKTKLADLEAKQYEKDGKIMTVAYDTGVLFTITTELKAKRETMLKLNETILTTFAFAPPESTDASSQTSGAGEEEVFFEGEEIIE